MFRFCINGAFRYFQQYGVRLTRFQYKHNGYLLNNPKSQDSHWFIRQDASLGSYENDRFFPDITSFDDFGILSLDRSKSSETVSTLGEKSFIDNLLRNDAYNVCDSVIPTTVDIKEMGETGDGIEQLEILLSEGYDVSAVINDFRSSQISDIPSQENVLNKEEVQENSDSPYLLPKDMNLPYRSPSFIPSEKLSTRVYLGNKRRLNRMVNPLSSDFTNSSETAVHSAIPKRIENQVAIPERFDSVERYEKCTIEEVQAALRIEDISPLRNLLMSKQWPATRDINSIIPIVFDFIVKYSKDTEEALMFFRDFAASNRRSFVRDEAVLDLAFRAVNEGGVPLATQLLIQVRNMFLTKAPMSANNKAKSRLVKLYKSSFEKGSVEEAQLLMQTLLDKGYSTNVQPFLRVAAQCLIEKQESFGLVFANWSKLASSYGDISGSEYVLQHALLDSDAKQSALKIGEVLKFTKLYRHPFKSIADIICAYIRFGQINKAYELMSKLSISGKYYYLPVDQFLQDDDGLAHIENFAGLVSKCMYGEKRRGGSKSKDTCVENVTVSTELMKVLDAHCGTSFATQSSFVSLKKKNSKKEHKKMHRVDDEQLHKLSRDIQDAWIILAESNKNYESAQRLLTWCQTHRVEISSNLSKRVSQLK